MLPEKMKAQIFYEKEKMALKTVDVPRPRADQVLVRVRACGVCGSDVAYYFGDSPLETPDGKGPLILGHEFSGDVAAVGAIPAAMGLFEEGDRVLANPVQNCGACPQCHRGQFNLCKNTHTLGVNDHGAYAEYVLVAYTHLFKLGEGLSYEDAALCEPLACACNGVEKLAVELGDFVVIFGPGPIGLMMLRLIKARGAGKVAMVGVIDYGLKKAREMGADYVLNTLDKASPYYTPDLKTAILNMTGGELADRVIVPTAAQSALEGALEVSGRRARIVYFGLPGEDTILRVPLLKTLQMDKTILVSWLAPGTWDMAVKAIGAGIVTAGQLVNHVYPLEGLEEALKVMRDPRETHKIKAMIRF